MRKLKMKRCRQCKELFTPCNSLHVCCVTRCAIDYAVDKREADLKRDIKRSESIKRKDLRQRKEKLKSRSDHENEAQKECNAYIRERDKDDGCISCGTTRQDIQYCAGHFKTVGGNNELRYHPLNIHKQCNYHCNSQKSGNISKYRPELIKKIGLLNVEWLEGPQKAQNRTIDDLKEIKAYYREQTKILKAKL